MRGISVCVLAMLLVGCVTSGGDSVEKGSSGPVDIAERDAHLASLDAFTVKGSLGFWDDQQNATARIIWQELAGQRDILLVAPLGIGRLRVVQTEAGARIERGDRPAVTGSDAGVLLAQALGLAAPVPLRVVSEWIRGLPGEQATQVERDERGRLERLRWQDERGGRWSARVLRYQAVDGQDLPALVTANSGGANLRLALSGWEFDFSEPAPEKAGTGVVDSVERLGIPGR